MVIYTTTGDTGKYFWKQSWVSATDVILQSSNVYCDTHCTKYFNIFLPF